MSAPREPAERSSREADPDHAPASGAARGAMPADEFAVFGLDGADEAWLDVFREAAAGESPGRIGPFEIEREAGRGGQGVVYKGRVAATGQPVAIKRIPRRNPGARGLVRRLEREMETVAALDHPGIVRLLEPRFDGRNEENSGELLLVMEWVDGDPLTAWADSLMGRGVPADVRRDSEHGGLREVVRVFLTVCDAVQHAHQRGVIHRDLKPSNILVCGKSNEPRARVLDFGLARLHGESTSGRGSGGPIGGRDDAREDTITASGGFVGTLAYASPEQLHARPGQADARSDIYSLGVVLYRALTGAMPYSTGGPLGEVVRAIERAGPPDPAGVVPGIDRDLAAVMQKALAKEVDERYQSIDAFASDLRRWSGGEPVLARAPGIWDRAWKYARRNRASSALAAAAVLVVAATSGISVGLAVKLAGERSEAVALKERESRARGVAERVAVFLRNTLSAARPSRQGPDANLLGMLRDAGERAEKELSADPEVAAEVQYTIGYTYRSLWMFTEALPHLEKALALASASHGELSEQAARCMTALGTCQSNTSSAAAVPTQRRALGIRRELYAGDHPDVAEGMMRLGYALFRSPEEPGRPAWDASEEMLNEALAMYARLYGDSHREVGSCLHNLAYMRSQQGRQEDAIEIFERAVQTFRRAGDTGDPYYAECLTGYVPVLAYRGRSREALTLVEELVSLTRSLYGELRAAGQMAQCASLRLIEGDLDGAERMYREAFVIACRMLAPREEECERTLRDAGALMEHAGTGDGPAVPTELFGLLAKLPRANRVRLGGMIDGLGWVALRRGDAAAEMTFSALAEQAAADRRGERDARAGSVPIGPATGLGASQIQRGDFGAAASTLRAALGDAEGEPAEYASPAVAYARAMLGWCKVKLGDRPAGMKELAEAYAALLEAHGRSHSRVREVAEWSMAAESAR